MGIVSSIGRETRELRAGGRGKSLVAIAGTWGTLIGTRAVYPVLLPYMRTSFGLSLTVAGLLVTVLWLGSSVGQLPSGVIADRYSERLVMVTSATVVALAVVCVVVAPTPIVLFAATGLVGLALSLYPIARMTILSDIYPDRIGSALGVTMAMGDLGQTILPPVGATIAAAVAWQAGLGFVVPFLILGGAVLWVTLPTRTSNAAGSDVGGGVENRDGDGGDASESGGATFSIERARSVSGELRRPRMLVVGIVLFLYLFIWQAFTGLYPTYLVEVKGLSSSVAGVLFSLFFAVGVVVKPLSGVAYDRIGLRNSLVIVLVGPVAGLVLLPAVGGFWPLVGVTVLVSTMLGSGAITQSFLTDAFSEATRGTGLGVIRTVTGTLAALGPVLLGGVADRGYFDEGYVALAAIAVAIVLLTLRLPRE